MGFAQQREFPGSAFLSGAPGNDFSGGPHSLLRQQLRFSDTGKDGKVMAMDFVEAA